ncbi:MAG: ribonuclease HI family protein [Patescibacteria group bacterium]|nr:ribonuclease HI family protein [Patescibacteria group bacterium]
MSSELIIHTDGGSRGNPGPAGIGVVVFCDNQVIYKQSNTIGSATNNQAEYQAFLSSLDWLLSHQSKLNPTRVIWKLDSLLVVEQINQNWKIKLPHLKIMAQEAWQGLKKLTCEYQIGYVPREENAYADSLVNQALDAK